MKTYSFFILFIISLISGCSNSGGVENEIVMTEGLVIEATNKNGTIKIEAGQGLARTYSWENDNITVKLKPRYERWYGSLGAYYPGDGRRIHAVLEEGQQHFSTESEALEWLDWKMDRMQYIYNPNGLVVGWNKAKGPGSVEIALHVDVWQLYVNGKKPVNLPGSQNTNIKTTYKSGFSFKQLQKSNFKPSQSCKVANRTYSGKAIDYMKDPAIQATSGEVEKTIMKGKLEQIGNYKYYYLLDGGFMWVKLDHDGRIVLLGK